mmetsp:Transcript_11954/g.30150  ORF Transcript_11954/g.30150 Transcript_11954/m.30150 type:complete len:158 (+) Transcript_11954:2649-3122(+)
MKEDAVGRVDEGKAVCAFVAEGGEEAAEMEVVLEEVEVCEDLAEVGLPHLELDVLDDAISTARVAAPSSKSKRASNIIEESSARGAPSESNVESMRDSLIGFLEFIVFGTFVFIPLVIILFIYLYRRKAKKANDIQEDEPDQASNLIRESPARGAPS